MKSVAIHNNSEYMPLSAAKGSATAHGYSYIVTEMGYMFRNERKSQSWKGGL
jgi:hypothetical protein